MDTKAEISRVYPLEIAEIIASYLDIKLLRHYMQEPARYRGFDYRSYTLDDYVKIYYWYYIGMRFNTEMIGVVGLVTPILQEERLHILDTLDDLTSDDCHSIISFSAGEEIDIRIKLQKKIIPRCYPWEKSIADPCPNIEDETCEYDGATFFKTMETFPLTILHWWLGSCTDPDAFEEGEAGWWTFWHNSGSIDDPDLAFTLNFRVLISSGIVLYSLFCSTCQLRESANAFLQRNIKHGISIFP